MEASLEPRVLVGFPCPNCEGSGEQERPDPRVPGVMQTYRCPACVNSPGYRKHEYVPLSEFRRLLESAAEQ